MATKSVSRRYTRAPITNPKTRVYTRAPITNPKTRGRARAAKPPRPDPGHPETWPAFWRVVAPKAGSYDHDMVFIETPDEDKARKEHANLRRAEWPVRLERVSCGPLPPNAAPDLERVRSANTQNADTQMPPVLAAWSRPERES